MPPVRSKDSIGRAQPHESGHEQDAHGWVVHSMSCFFSKTSYECRWFSRGCGAAIASEHSLDSTTLL